MTEDMWGRYYGFGLCLDLVYHDGHYSYSDHPTQDSANNRTNRRTICIEDKYILMLTHV